MPPTTALAASVLTGPEEDRRRSEHPGVDFQDGVTGRRATLVHGPDVWEVVGAVRRTSSRRPTATLDEVVEAVEQGSDVAPEAIRTALRYATAFPEEIEARIAANDRAERQLLEELTQRRVR